MSETTSTTPLPGEGDSQLAPNAELVQRVDTVRSDYQATIAPYLGQTVDEFDQDLEKTLQQNSWEKVRKTDQFTTTAANLNRLTNHLNGNAEAQLYSTELTYLAAVESYTAVVKAKVEMGREEHETLEKLDGLAARTDGRKMVSELIYSMADIRDARRRDTSLTQQERVEAGREKAELDEFGMSFANMDIVRLDPDAHNDAMDAANDYMERGWTADTTIEASEAAVEKSIRHNVLYAKYAAELANSVTI